MYEYEYESDFYQDDVFNDEHDYSIGDDEMATGLDPEFFVTDPQGLIVPAERFIEQPAASSAQVVYDNAAVEVRPSHNTCLEGLGNSTMMNIREAYVEMRKARQAGSIRADSEIDLVPAARLRKADRELDSVQQFGCSPSLCVDDDMNVNKVVPFIDPNSTPWRSAGFHVHQGLSGGVTSVALKNQTAKAAAVLDGMIGLIDVQMNHLARWTRQSRVRRDVIGYGRAGEFRIRPTGNYNSIFEYRVMSPWPLSHPIWAWWVASAVRQVACRTGGSVLDTLLEGFPNRSEITNAINTSNTKAAVKLWKACVRVWMKQINCGFRGNDALHPENLERVLLAMQNGGHEFYTLGWKMHRVWFKNSGAVSVIELGRQRTIYNNHVAAGNLHGAYTGYQKNQLRTGWNYRYFPSGSTNIIKDHYATYTPPELDSYIQEA